MNAPSEEDRRAIGLDVGGTKIAAGIVTGTGRILHRAVVPTPRPADAAVLRRTLTELAVELKTSFPGVVAVGVGAAGMIDWPSGHIRWAPNSTYRDLPLQQALAHDVGLPALVENDANAAAWAERRAGAGAGHRNVIVLTVGTGIGGGIIIDGRLHRGHTGIGAEVGHLIVAPEGGHLCGCGVTGCLEAMASGTALGRAGRAAATADPAGMLATIAGHADSVTGETVFAAAGRGDPVARGLFDQLGYWLGAGIASLVNLFDPEIVILTGGLITTGDLLLAPTRNSFERFVFAPQRRTLPAIIPARLGTDAGLIGAALLALDRQPARTQDNTGEPHAPSPQTTPH